MSVLPVVGSAIDTVAGLFNSKWERDAARRNTEDTIRAQKELAEYSYNKDVEMWNKNNAYNTPSEQMKRLEAAGLNPNMVYGSGTVAGNTSSQTPKYQMYDPQYKNVPFRLDLPSMLDVLSRYQDLKIKKSQNESIQADIERKDVENFYLGSQLGMKSGSSFLDYMAKKAEFGQMDDLGDLGIFKFDKGKNSYGFNPSFYKSIASKLLLNKSDMSDSELRRSQTSVKVLDQDRITRELENRLLKMGVNRNDNFLMRMFIQNDGTNFLNNLWNKTKK